MRFSSTELYACNFRFRTFSNFYLPDVIFSLRVFFYTIEHSRNYFITREITLVDERSRIWRRYYGFVAFSVVLCICSSTPSNIETWKQHAAIQTNYFILLYSRRFCYRARTTETTKRRTRAARASASETQSRDFSFLKFITIQASVIEDREGSYLKLDAITSPIFDRQSNMSGMPKIA